MVSAWRHLLLQLSLIWFPPDVAGPPPMIRDDGSCSPVTSGGNKLGEGWSMLWNRFSSLVSLALNLLSCPLRSLFLVSLYRRETAGTIRDKLFHLPCSTPSAFKRRSCFLSTYSCSLLIFLWGINRCLSVRKMWILIIWNAEIWSTCKLHWYSVMVGCKCGRINEQNKIILVGRLHFPFRCPCFLSLSLQIYALKRIKSNIVFKRKCCRRISKRISNYFGIISIRWQELIFLCILWPPLKIKNTCTLNLCRKFERVCLSMVDLNRNW